MRIFLLDVCQIRKGSFAVQLGNWLVVGQDKLIPVCHRSDLASFKLFFCCKKVTRTGMISQKCNFLLVKFMSVKFLPVKKKTYILNSVNPYKGLPK